ncbi:MAG: PEP-CTERM sorting domain-containing protein [Bryobacterales bacterium]|nr:PEP-CTERM sorting domain-containing protein [Bryobacterales bacterium]
MGPAAPSSINVVQSGPIHSITVEFTGLTHTFPDDPDILLVGPTGASVILVSDTGGNLDLLNVSLVFSSTALLSLPDGNGVTSGTFLPTNFGSLDVFSSPAPPGPYGDSLDVFQELAASGTWRLFTQDDLSGDGGSLAAWSLTIRTEDTSNVPEPGSTTLLVMGCALLWLARRRNTACQ